MLKRFSQHFSFTIECRIYLQMQDYLKFQTFVCEISKRKYLIKIFTIEKKLLMEVTGGYSVSCLSLNVTTAAST